MFRYNQAFFSKENIPNIINLAPRGLSIGLITTLICHGSCLIWVNTVLQYRLPKNISRREEQTTKVVTGVIRINHRVSDVSD